MAEKTTIARPYAQAVLALAKEQNALQQWSEMLQFAAAVTADEEMAAIIASPRLSSEQLAGLFLDICGDKLNEHGKNMIRVLAENDRLDVLAEITVLFEIERALSEGTIEAQVVSAVELNDAQKSGITESLKKRLGRDVTLNCSVDASIVGGAIIRAGDVVIDGSVTGKLAKLATALNH
ncbi:MAG: F0F1 ATP synthase subunit delta [Chromatiales bacterium]|nr:F0F1 ATP synthase subunit delta [Chromatiales bacterium]